MFVVCLCALTACPEPEPSAPPPAPTPSPASGGELVFGVIGEPWSLSPRPRYPSDLSRSLREPLGSFRVAGRTEGLEIVFEAVEGDAAPLLDRLTVRFVQNIDIAFELLEQRRLHAASLPATVNLLERADAKGLNGSAAPSDEVIYLDLRGAELDRAERAGLAGLADVEGLDEAFVRDLGRPSETLHPTVGARGAAGPFDHRVPQGLEGAGRRIQLAAPVGDELLGLMQRALHDDWERHGFVVDVVTIDARTFYGPWAADPAIDVALRRGDAPHLPSDRAARAGMSAVPLFQMHSVVVWNDGVHGVAAPGGGGDPLARAGRWWIDG